MLGAMRAQRFYADSKEIAVDDAPIPELGPGGVLDARSQLAVATQGHGASGTKIPDDVSLEQAILADAVPTPYGAVVRTGKVGITEPVGRRRGGWTCRDPGAIAGAAPPWR